MIGPLTAVTGASGAVGGRVARRLARTGVPVRLLGRDPARLPDVPGADHAPAAPYGDGEAMRRALDGAHTLFLVSAHESPHRVREHTTAIDAAVAVGVERIVYVSFQGPRPTPRSPSPATTGTPRPTSARLGSATPSCGTTGTSRGCPR